MTPSGPRDPTCPGNGQARWVQHYRTLIPHARDSGGGGARTPQPLNLEVTGTAKTHQVPGPSRGHIGRPTRHETARLREGPPSRGRYHAAGSSPALPNPSTSRPGPTLSPALATARSLSPWSGRVGTRSAETSGAGLSQGPASGCDPRRPQHHAAPQRSCRNRGPAATGQPKAVECVGHQARAAVLCPQAEGERPPAPPSRSFPMLGSAGPRPAPAPARGALNREGAPAGPHTVHRGTNAADSVTFRRGWRETRRTDQGRPGWSPTCTSRRRSLWATELFGARAAHG